MEENAGCRRLLEAAQWIVGWQSFTRAFAVRRTALAAAAIAGRGRDGREPTEVEQIGVSDSVSAGDELSSSQCSRGLGVFARGLSDGATS